MGCRFVCELVCEYNGKTIKKAADKCHNNENIIVSILKPLRKMNNLGLFSYLLCESQCAQVGDLDFSSRRGEAGSVVGTG